MVSIKLFYQIHKLLNETFSPGQDVTFGRKSTLLAATSSCKTSIIFNYTETMERFISMDLLHKLRLAELDQVMRQDDEIFVNMLNKIRVGEIDQKV